MQLSRPVSDSHSPDHFRFATVPGNFFATTAYTRSTLGYQRPSRVQTSTVVRPHVDPPSGEVFGVSDLSAVERFANDHQGALAEDHGDFCSNFVCCDLKMSDLHALLEHRERAHADQHSFQYETFWKLQQELQTHPPTPISSPRRGASGPTHLAQANGRDDKGDGAVQPAIPLPTGDIEHAEKAVRRSGSSSQASHAWSTRKVGPGAPTRILARALLSKGFDCIKPGCALSYKTRAGRNYHATRGECSADIPMILKFVRIVLAEKGLSDESVLSRDDAREVKREAERRYRPFACTDDGCQRRYKNLRDLRRHRAESALLASERHALTQAATGASKLQARPLVESTTH